MGLESKNVELINDMNIVKKAKEELTEITSKNTIEIEQMKKVQKKTETEKTKLSLKLDENLLNYETSMKEFKNAWETKLNQEKEQHVQMEKDHELKINDIQHSMTSLTLELSVNKEKVITAEKYLKKAEEMLDTSETRCTAEIKKRRELEIEVRELRGSILVCARIRPKLKFENNESTSPTNDNNNKNNKSNSRNPSPKSEGSNDPVGKASDVVTMFRDEGEILVTQRGGTGIARFEFDHVFSPSSSQTDVCKIASDVVPGLLRGQCMAILAYGQTGSGKTYTMEGPNDSIDDNQSVVYEEDDDDEGKAILSNTTSELASILKRRRRMSEVINQNGDGGGNKCEGGGDGEIKDNNEKDNNEQENEKIIGVYEAVLQRLFNE